MKEKFLEPYFKLVAWFLYLSGALPERKKLDTQLSTFLLNSVWPVAFISFWIPLFFMVTLKVLQYIQNKQWEDLFDIMHMYFLGCNTLYIFYAVQKTSKLYKSTMDKIKRDFVSWVNFGLKDSPMMIVLWLTCITSFSFYVSGTIYYREVLVPCWIPFIDNNQPLPTSLFFAVWVYEGLGGIYMLITYDFMSPFVIVSNIVIVKEVYFLIKQLEHFKFEDGKYHRQDENLCFVEDSVTANDVVLPSYGNLFKERMQYINVDDYSSFRTFCCSESDTTAFIRDFVKHHRKIRSVIHDVSKIHRYIFFTQALFTVSHSCFLAFNMYYTKRPTKVIVKSSPILFLSYYLLFIFCWNGQRLTDACNELFRALYCCDWYNCPRSFKSSLIIMMQFCHRPDRLTGGGFITASLQTFLHGLQQSISYILFLKQLTSTKTK